MPPARAARESRRRRAPDDGIISQPLCPIQTAQREKWILLRQQEASHDAAFGLRVLAVTRGRLRPPGSSDGLDPILLVAPGSGHSERESLKRLQHEYALRDALDPGWPR